MRFTLIGVFFYISFAWSQKTPWSHNQINEYICLLPDQSILADSLIYIDSACQYYKNDLPYTGYVVHHFDQTLRFNRYENGTYFGEEWIFHETTGLWDCDSLRENLWTFRIRSDTNSLFTVVTSYYDFASNRVEEIYISDRYTCMPRKSAPQFDIIFGSDYAHDLPYKQYYPNGNLKETWDGLEGYRSGTLTHYYENGQLASLREYHEANQSGLIKEMDENGQCIRRIKFRHNKIRGFYVIDNGKIYPAFVAQRQNKKRSKS